MDRNFYFLKGGVLVLALAIASYSSGFQLTKILGNVDRVHYAAASYADDTIHRATHDASHALGKFMARFHHAETLADVINLF